jgi:hypothetical protein
MANNETARKETVPNAKSVQSVPAKPAPIAKAVQSTPAVPATPKAAQPVPAASVQSAQPPPPKTKEEKERDEKMAAIIKELEQAFFALKFYPVATKEEAKEQAVAKIKEHYAKGDDTVKQLVLYMMHETLSQAAEMRTMHNLEQFRRKMPGADPGQLRISVYRAMFNYNYSLEGLAAIISLLADLGGDDAAKVLTYHFTFFSSMESDSNRMLRNAVVDALGASNSPYALQALLSYIYLTDNDLLFGRLFAALKVWEGKIEKMNIPKKDKKRLLESIEGAYSLKSDEHRQYG